MMDVQRIAFAPRKPFKKLCSSNCFFSRSYFQHSESFYTIFPQFKAQLYTDRPFFKSAVFWVQQNCKWNNTHTHIITHFSTFTCATALFQAGKHSSGSALYASSSKNNAVLQSVGETI